MLNSRGTPKRISSPPHQSVFTHKLSMNDEQFVKLGHQVGKVETDLHSLIVIKSQNQIEGTAVLNTKQISFSIHLKPDGN